MAWLHRLRRPDKPPNIYGYLVEGTSEEHAIADARRRAWSEFGDSVEAVPVRPERLDERGAEEPTGEREAFIRRLK